MLQLLILYLAFAFKKNVAIKLKGGNSTSDQSSSRLRLKDHVSYKCKYVYIDIIDNDQGTLWFWGQWQLLGIWHELEPQSFVSFFQDTIKFLEQSHPTQELKVRRLRINHSRHPKAT